MSRNYSGVVKAFYNLNENDGKFTPDRNRPKYEYTLKNGVIDGVYREWWNNGRLRYYIEYSAENGRAVRDGMFHSYSYSGNLVRSRKFLKGIEVIRKKTNKTITK